MVLLNTLSNFVRLFGSDLLFNKTIKLRKKLQKRALRFLDNDCISSCGQLLEKLSKTIAIVKMCAIIVPSV